MCELTDLPTEMLLKIFSLTCHCDRRNIDLTCKRFEAITRKYEDKMAHKCYKWMTVLIKQSQNDDNISKLDVLLQVPDDFRKNNVGKISFVDTYDDFFANLKKIKFTESGTVITIQFDKHFQFLFKLKNEIQKMAEIDTVLLKYTGPPKMYSNIQFLSNNWSQAIKTNFAISVTTPFNLFAINCNSKYLEFKSLINLALVTDARHDNFDISVWTHFIEANKLNTISFLCEEKINMTDMLEFSNMILNMIESEKINGFKVFLSAANYSIMDIIFIIQNIRSLNYEVIRVQSENQMTLKCFRNGVLFKDDCPLWGSLQLSFIKK